jgi:hypothetical protein
LACFPALAEKCQPFLIEKYLLLLDSHLEHAKFEEYKCGHNGEQFLHGFGEGDQKISHVEIND